MPLDNRTMLSRKNIIMSSKISDSRSGGAIKIKKKSRVAQEVNLTNGIVGMHTVAPTMNKPRINDAPVFQSNNKSILDDFKKMSFNPKKKTNIKLKL